VSFLVTFGVNNECYLKILGICRGIKENKAGWSAFLKQGAGTFRGVRLIISDACLGLCENVAGYFPEAAWQRCIVHWYRNIFPRDEGPGARGHAHGDPCQLALALEDVEQTLAAADATAENDSTARKQVMPRRQQINRGTLPPNLPRDEIIIDIAE
jgi:putative transposase